MRNKAMTLSVASLLTASLWLPAWSWAQNYPPSVTELIARAKAQIKTIDMATFKSEFDKKSLGLIIDVREPGEYAEGHIPGAINIPRGQIEFKIWPHVGFPDKLDLATKITLYCASGLRGSLAAKSLKDLKFADVTAADMRIEEWRNAGYPLDRD
ncbi:MAG TPA: rhodanese-like domain-containing protein [Burkholderiaceae bacterium]|nr:rhodanese-like domain-containing protein [Burkholderiaceae bacterium]